LLLAHYDQEPDEEDKPELIGGMLTAIRDFMRDSFGDGSPDQDLYDIQYGDAQIVIQNGQFAYIAAVIGGTEPEGFRDALKEFVAELHIQYRPQLRDFDGDHDRLPDFSEQIRELEKLSKTNGFNAKKDLPSWRCLCG
jgi:OOP family OmpA-OmpF porin